MGTRNKGNVVTLDKVDTLKSGPDSMPEVVYSERAAAAEVARAAADQRDALLGNLRLLAVVTALLGYWLGGIWLAGAAIVFFGVATWRQERCKRDLADAQARIAYYDRGLARLRGRWQGGGVQGADLAPEHHPFAADLDLLGPGSLFDLLCTTRTRFGENHLAAFLLEGASADAAIARQACVRELAPQLDFRERLALLGGEVSAHAHPEAVRAWAAAPPRFQGRAARIGIVALTLVPLALAVLSWWTGTWLPFVLALTVGGVGLKLFAAPLRDVRHGGEVLRRELNLLANMLQSFEAASFQSPRLRALQAQLRQAGEPASAAIAHLDRLVMLQSLHLNQFFVVLDLLLAWSLHVALRQEAWRIRHGKAMSDWLDALGELEALLALSAFAYEHPDYSYPEFAAGSAVLEAEELGHPLLPAARCVRNDLSLGPDAPLIVISGSNMSGKSTLLRAIGVNVVLASAGAPVCATRFRLDAFSLGATMRVHDSLQEGASRFYAEILRLKQFLELAEGGNRVLFLCDEILHGTNSNDRLHGARAVIGALMERGAIGLMTTHDLALTDIGKLAVGGRNMHLEDALGEGGLVFDYKLRPGVVEKSNALALMRAIGLPV